MTGNSAGEKEVTEMGWDGMGLPIGEGKLLIIIILIPHKIYNKEVNNYISSWLSEATV